MTGLYPRFISALERYTQNFPDTPPAFSEDGTANNISYRSAVSYWRQGLAARFLHALDKRDGQAGVESFIERFLAYQTASEEAFLLGTPAPRLELQSHEIALLHELYPEIEQRDHRKIRRRANVANGVIGIGITALALVLGARFIDKINKPLTEQKTSLLSRGESLKKKQSPAQEDIRAVAQCDTELALLEEEQQNNHMILLGIGATGGAGLVFTATQIIFAIANSLNLKEKNRKKEAIITFLECMGTGLDDLAVRLGVGVRDLPAGVVR